MSQSFTSGSQRKYWSFSFSISPSNEHPGLISSRMDWLDPLAVQGTQESSPTPRFKSINSSVLSFLYGPALTSIHDHWENHSTNKLLQKPSLKANLTIETKNSNLKPPQGSRGVFW